MLDANQIADLDAAERDIQNKKLILDTAIDIQALLRLLVDKEIITREEVNRFREEVRESPKWSTASLYINQNLAEIQAYQNNPELRLKAMINAKMKGK